MNLNLPIRHTLAESGYVYAGFDHRQGVHVLRDRVSGRLEAWFANKGHASYGLRWRNTDLEFARGYRPS
jgi:hypothetical protein